MEYVIELLLDLLLETSMSASINTKLPKWVRYVLIILISLFFLSVIGIVFLTAFLIFKESIYAGLIIGVIGLILLISFIFKFKNLYLKRKN